MPKGSPTALFVSSTCYDLSQVRAVLRNFVTSLGFEPILSESDTFPVNPTSDAVSSCLEAVRERADLFVLVVGGRYGSLTETGLSVTNMEFIEALAKGIPIYVFVKADILALLPKWKANKEADFSNTVDSPKLFQFIDDLKSKQNLWVFPFQNADEICSVLKKQLSYLMADCLDIRKRLNPIDPVIGLLGPNSLRTYLEKQRAWEYFALAHCLQENIDRYQSKRLDFEIGISFGDLTHLEDRNATLKWIGRKMEELKVIVINLENVMNRAPEPALGPPGVPGDMVRIAHLGKRFGEGYLAILDWALEFRRVSAPDDFAHLLELVSHICKNTLLEIEDYAAGLHKRLFEIFENNQSGKFKLALTLTMPDISEIETELNRLSKV